MHGHNVSAACLPTRTPCPHLSVYLTFTSDGKQSVTGCNADNMLHWALISSMTSCGPRWGMTACRKWDRAMCAVVRAILGGSAHLQLCADAGLMLWIW